MKHLYLMRHGQTLFNLKKQIQGYCDSPLTKLGINQAKQAGKILADIPFDHYYCSTAERCSDTLELATGIYQYKRLKGLKERNYGLLEGESEALVPSLDNADKIYTIYHGETRSQVQERMFETLSTIMELDDHHSVLAVSHAGAIFNFLLMVEPLYDIRKQGGIPNCGILHFTYDNHTFKFIELIK